MGWYNDSWQYRIKVTVDNTKVSGSSDLTDFPVYLNLDDLPDAFFTTVKSAGKDIRITTSDGETEVPREIVSIDTSGKTGEVHFKGTLTYNADTEFYIYYGNASAATYSDTDTYGAQNVWSSSYLGVWHKNDLTTSTIQDSTSNDNDGTKKGANEPIEATGKVGEGQDYDGEDDYIDISLDEWASSLSDITISFWSKSSHDSKRNTPFIALTDDFGNRLCLHLPWFGGQIIWDFGDINNGGRLTSTWNAAWNNVWCYWAVASASSGQYIYRNGGKLVSDEDGSTFTRGTKELRLAYYYDWNSFILDYWDATFDELRIASTKRSAGWIATEYNNQNSSSTFYSVGSEEEPEAAAAGNCIFFGMNF
jgi:hypothetical protein